MTMEGVTARVDGSRTEVADDETFVVALGFGSCEADHAADVPAGLTVEQDEASRTTFRVVLDIGESDPDDTATCQVAGISTEVPTNAELFLFAWADAMQTGVPVELGQTAVVEGTDASGQIPHRIEVTVRPTSG